MPSSLPLKSQEKLYLQLPAHHHLSAVILKHQCHYSYNHNILQLRRNRALSVVNEDLSCVLGEKKNSEQLPKYKSLVNPDYGSLSLFSLLRLSLNPSVCISVIHPSFILILYLQKTFWNLGPEF